MPKPKIELGKVPKVILEYNTIFISQWTMTISYINLTKIG